MHESDCDRDPRLEQAERILGHTFIDRKLLRVALTHPSALEVHDPAGDYERMEFLGDSIIGLIIAEEVFRRFPTMPEGGMTRIKVSIVAGTVLARVSEELGLADVIILGDSERGTGRRGLNSALENAFEALTAALYLDAGIDEARAWVMRTLGPLVLESVALSPESPKSELQERVQARGGTIEYRILSHEGPPHDRTFVAQALIDGAVVATGTGRSKKEAEAAAAAAALEAQG